MTHADMLSARSAPRELSFAQSRGQSIGVELELGIVDPVTMDLVSGAPRLLASLARDGFGGHFKAEVTDAMIELNSSVHASAASLQTELTSLVQTLLSHAQRLQLRVIGGGTHPFQEWPDREISSQARFQDISHTYGYLAKQFTVFGQHVHVGCASGDDAIYLTHSLTRHAPLLMALSAASPFWRSVDTGYESCRMNVVNAFPLSGVAPGFRSWSEFKRFFERMYALGVTQAIKDFYWDVRPQPRFGTVEVRVFDTPLRIEEAVDHAALVQALATEQLSSPRQWPGEFFEVIHAHNRFQASRFGLNGKYIDTLACRSGRIKDILLDLLEHLTPHFLDLGSRPSQLRLQRRLTTAETNSAWLRRRYDETSDLRTVVGEMSAALEGATQ